MHQFIEVSPLGEFVLRLKLLQSFSCDMCLEGKRTLTVIYLLLIVPSHYEVLTSALTLSGHATLGNVLVNTVCYYKQFVPLVLSHSTKLTSTVDKEFKVSWRPLAFSTGLFRC